MFRILTPCLLVTTIIIAKSLDIHVGKAEPKVGPVLDPNCLTL